MKLLVPGSGGPTGENVVARNPRWGTCLYCFLENEREVKLLRSPIVGGGVKCPGCGRRWHDAAAYNADIKAAMERADFYASTGVTLSTVDFRENTLSIVVQPVPGVDYEIQFIGATRNGMK